MACGVVVPEPEEEDVAFTPPEGLVCQPNMTLPSTMREFAIIEKTAQFVSQQGGQMEIFIKMKQGNNPQFKFLGFEDPLNPFYKWLVVELKANRYKPKPLALPEDESEEEDSEEDHYLHPSLFAAKTSPIKIPTLAFKGSGEDAYSMLVKNLQNLVSSESRGSSPGNNPPGQQDEDSPAPPPPPGLEPVQLPATTVSPPPHIQAIIDKMAIYASKNGEDFETIVKSKEDKRFDFLYPWNQFHQYYLHRKKHYCAENSPPTEDKPPAKPAVKVTTGPPAPVSFSLKPKEDGSQEKPKASLLLEPDSETDAPQATDDSDSPKELDTPRKQEARMIADKLKDKLAAAARDRLQARKVQLERKRKAAIFLDQLKSLNNGTAAPPTAPAAETSDPPACDNPESPRREKRKRSVTPSKKSDSAEEVSPVKRARSSSSSSSSSGRSRRKKHSKKHSKKKKKKKHHHRHKSPPTSKSSHRAKTPPAAYLLVRRSHSPSRYSKRSDNHRESSRRHRR